MHAYRGTGVRPGRDDPELRQGPSRPRRAVGHRLAVASISRSRENFGNGQQWKFYYLYGLERAARLAGVRFFGTHDWYRVGAEELVERSGQAFGILAGRTRWRTMRSWQRASRCLFLAKGRAPVLINKLRHAPVDDWDNDPDDVRNIVDVVGRDWKALLTWQIVDSQTATVADLLQGADPLLQRTQGAGVHARREAESAGLCEQGRFPLRRSLLQRARVRPRLPAVDEGTLPRRR